MLRPHDPLLMTQNYFRDEETTRRAFQRGWYATGDAGTRDEDGYYRFAGRLKDFIRRRGENISAFEVEREALTHPAVREAAAVAVPVGSGRRGDQAVRPAPRRRPTGAENALASPAASNGRIHVAPLHRGLRGLPAHGYATGAKVPVGGRRGPRQHLGSACSGTVGSRLPLSPSPFPDAGKGANVGCQVRAGRVNRGFASGKERLGDIGGGTTRG